MDQPKIRAKAMCVVMRNDNEILVHLGEDLVRGIKFGRVVGGSIEFGETSEQAVQREFMEELGSKLENLKLLEVTENIFEFRGQPGHEVVFLYTGDLVDKSFYQKDRMKMLDSDLEVIWLPLSEVKNRKIELFPIPKMLKL